MKAPLEPPEVTAWRPTMWLRPRSVHWVGVQYACIGAFFLLGGVHGRGTFFLGSMFVVSLLGLVHALVELAVPEQRGAVHPVITIVLLGGPFLLPVVALFDL